MPVKSTATQSPLALRVKAKSSRASANNRELKLRDEEVFVAFTNNFADGLAIFAPNNRLAYFNEPYRRMLNPIADALLIGMAYDDILAVGVTRKIWDTLGLPDDQWRVQNALSPVQGTTEQCIKFSDGRWFLRRNTRGDNGYTVQLCSDLTLWKKREEETALALQRAERAEQEARLALLAEEFRKKEDELLSRLNHWLHSCKRMEELYEVVQLFFTQLLVGSSGILYVYNNSRDVLVPVCSWNRDKAATEIKPDDCWGLRQGRAYHYGHDGWRFACDHKRTPERGISDSRYFCIPILAHGDTAGMLHVEPPAGICANDQRFDSAFKVACKCAEQISLAIANVKLGQELKDQSTQDSLTNLYNRRYFLERCSREVKRSNQTQLPSTVISLDVDHFKKFNDNFGHDAGDAVLKRFAREMLAHFRGDDIVCRMGGEEFCVLLPGAPKHVGMRRAETFLPKVQAMQIRYGNETLPPVTVSAGVITFPECGDSVEVILKAADRALYSAKANGRNCVVSSECCPTAESH